MPRITPVDPKNANGKAKELLDVVQKKMGGTPNILTTMARGPAALDAYLKLSGALSESSLSAGLREQVALAVAGANGCEYCAAAHTKIGEGAGLSKDELSSALAGEATDRKAKAAIDFARVLVEKRGWASDGDLEAAREGGLSDGEIMELIGVVVLNIFTNYVNHVAQTDIDFPKVDLPAKASV